MILQKTAHNAMSVFGKSSLLTKFAVCGWCFVGSALAQTEPSEVFKASSNAMESKASLVVDKSSDAFTTHAMQTFQTQTFLPNSALFSVLLPVDISLGQKHDNPITPELLTAASQIMLLRLTGRLASEKLPAGELFIQQAKRWLKSYNWVPVLQDGVKVDEQLQLNFDEPLIQAFFEEQGLKLWPKLLRPKILVMGAMVQQGTVQKLTAAQFKYQSNTSLLPAGEKFALPLSAPVALEPWIYPLNPQKQIGVIQDWLIASQSDYLLTYKVDTQDDNQGTTSQYELSWRLFSQAGEDISRGRLFGVDRLELLNEVIPRIMSRLVDVTEKKLTQQAQLRLNLVQVEAAEQLIQAKQTLQQDFPTINTLHLSEVEGDLAQFAVDFNGGFHDFLIWLQKHPSFSVVHESEALHQIDVTYIMPVEEVEDKAQNSLKTRQGLKTSPDLNVPQNATVESAPVENVDLIQPKAVGENGERQP